MLTTLRNTALALVTVLSLVGAARAQTPPAPAAATESAEDLRQQLIKAKEKLNAYKAELAAARNGKDRDKEAIKAIQAKIQDDQKAIQDVNAKIRAQKTAAKGAKPPATP